MIITVWDAVDKPKGRTIETSWEALPDAIKALPAGALWSPAEYRDGYHDSAAYLRSHAIVLDHDAATVPIEDVPMLLAGTRAFVHKTKRPGRWRAVIDTDSPLTAAEYESAVEPIARALECARESWSPYHMWFVPNGSAIVQVHGEPHARYSPRIRAWIAGDWSNPVISRDLPIRPDGAPDRSTVDMMLTHALLGAGVSDDEIMRILVSRGPLSHRTDTKYADMTIRKAKERQAKQIVWANKGFERAPDDNRPVIRCGPDIDRVADESAVVLAQRPDVYARGEQIVCVTGTEAHQLTHVRVADELSKGAVFVKAVKDGERATEPPDRVCKILAERKTHKARPLRIIAPFPLVRPDGSVMREPGYDPVTESLFVGAPVEQIDMSPAEALKALRSPFTEFPYERPEMIDVIVSLILTVVCRQAIAGNVPIFVLDASQKGAGKSLLATSVSLLAFGQHVAFESWPDDMTELDKKLSAIALSAVPYASFDEAQSVGGGPLNSLLTGNGRHAFRRLGKSERVMASWHTVLSVAANNIVIKGDTRRRAIECRLTPGAVKREHALDLHDWIPRNRARLLGAAISLVRAHIGSGAAHGPAWPSFERWSQVVAGAIIAAGGNDVTAFRTKEEEGDEERAREALTTWIALRFPNGATAREIADDLGGEMGMISEKAKETFASCPGIEAPVKDALRTITLAQKGKGVAQALGMALRNWRQVRTPEGMYLERNGNNPPVWRVEAEEIE